MGENSGTVDSTSANTSRGTMKVKTTSKPVVKPIMSHGEH